MRRPPSGRRYPWWLGGLPGFLLAIFLGALLSLLGRPATIGLLPVSAQSRLRSDYSADPADFRVAALNPNLVIEALRDLAVEGTAARTPVDIRQVFALPIPSVTPMTGPMATGGAEAAPATSETTQTEAGPSTTAPAATGSPTRPMPTSTATKSTATPTRRAGTATASTTPSPRSTATAPATVTPAPATATPAAPPATDTSAPPATEAPPAPTDTPVPPEPTSPGGGYEPPPTSPPPATSYP